MKKMLEYLSVVMLSSCVASSAAATKVDIDVQKIQSDIGMWKEGFEQAKAVWDAEEAASINCTAFQPDNTVPKGIESLGEYLSHYLTVPEPQLGRLVTEFRSCTQRALNKLEKTSGAMGSLLPRTPFGESLFGMMDILSRYKTARETRGALILNKWHDLRRLDRLIRIMSHIPLAMREFEHADPVNLTVEWRKTGVTSFAGFRFSSRYDFPTWPHIGSEIDAERLGRFCAMVPVDSLNINITQEAQQQGLSFKRLWWTILRDSSGKKEVKGNTVRKLVLRGNKGAEARSRSPQEPIGIGPDGCLADIRMAKNLTEITLDTIELGGIDQAYYIVGLSPQLTKLELSNVKLAMPLVINGDWRQLRELKIADTKQVKIEALSGVPTLSDLGLRRVTLDQADVNGFFKWLKNRGSEGRRITFDNVTFNNVRFDDPAIVEGDKGKAEEVRYILDKASNYNLGIAKDVLSNIAAKKIVLGLKKVDSEERLFRFLKDISEANAGALSELKLLYCGFSKGAFVAFRKRFGREFDRVLKENGITFDDQFSC